MQRESRTSEPKQICTDLPRRCEKPPTTKTVVDLQAHDLDEVFQVAPVRSADLAHDIVTEVTDTTRVIGPALPCDAIGKPRIAEDRESDPGRPSMGRPGSLS